MFVNVVMVGSDAIISRIAAELKCTPNGKLQSSYNRALLKQDCAFSYYYIVVLTIDCVLYFVCPDFGTFPTMSSITIYIFIFFTKLSFKIYN